MKRTNQIKSFITFCRNHNSSGLVAPKAQQTVITTVLMLLCLSAWSFSSPISSGLDSIQHLATVWCANGESAGECQQIRNENSVLVANVPVIDPASPLNSDGTQTFQITSFAEQSLFYKVMHLFVQKDPTRSVIFMRLFNAAIFSIVVSLLLNLGKKNFRFATLISITFTINPILISTVSQVNPRSWAITSVISSWAFLGMALEHEQRSSKIYYSLLYGFSVMLAVSSRWDAALFVLFTTLIMVIRHLHLNKSLDVQKLAIRGAFFACLFIVMRIFSETLRIRTSFQFFNSYPKSQFVLFQLVHIPENIADGLGLGIRYFDIGPNVIGIIGVSLFSIAIAFSLRASTSFSKTLALITLIFIFLVMFRMTAVWNTLTPPVGAYTASLLTFLLGISSIDSSQDQLPFQSKTWRLAFISLLTYSHLLSLYSRLEWSTTPIEKRETIGTYTNLSLGGGWWWNTRFSPSFVLFLGTISLAVWLTLVWNYALKNYSDSNNETLTSVSP